MTNRYLIRLAYHGKRFCGWQVQPNAVTVQGVLQHELSKLLRNDVEITGCGRTDTGVHATNFYAHFDFESLPYTEETLVFKLNSMLNDDIAIMEIREVSKDFHARFSAISRTYEYHIHQHKNPFRSDRSLLLHWPLDIDNMNRAAETLIRKADFSSFSKTGSLTKTNICDVKEAGWRKTDDELIFRITADRFLRNMVRAIVGTMIDVGRGRIRQEEVADILAKRNRSEAGFSAPAHGLFLVDVAYPEGLI